MSEALQLNNTLHENNGDGNGVPIVVERLTLSNFEVEGSAKAYAEYRDQQDGGVRVGLYGYDLEKALKNPNSVLMQYEEAEKAFYAPLLIPLEELEWYNIDLFKKIYGLDTKFYYYAHPPMPSLSHSLEAVKKFIASELDSGTVIVTEQYKSQAENDLLYELAARSEDGKYVINNMEVNGLERKDDVFAGPVNFNGITEIKEAPSIADVYKQAVTEGEYALNPANGVALLETIDGEEAERVWEVYEAPFAKLGADDPTFAGFDKETLMDILSDPRVAKIVNRVNGKITSLCFFVQDFNNCPWFNPKYYEKNFPEYYKTNNILIFPGIVSDEQMKGSSYSGELIDLATKLYAKRGSNALITFECTEISSRYIPRIVTRAINHTGVGTVTNLEEPLSTMTYRVLRKANSST